jgi:hypothetical protein
MANTNFQFKRVATKAQDFSMSKDHTPPETKTNKTTSPQTKANQPSAPPEVENPMFYQMSLDKPQYKYRPLKQ